MKNKRENGGGKVARDQPIRRESVGGLGVGGRLSTSLFIRAPGTGSGSLASRCQGDSPSVGCVFVHDEVYIYMSPEKANFH